MLLMACSSVLSRFLSSTIRAEAEDGMRVFSRLVEEVWEMLQAVEHIN